MEAGQLRRIQVIIELVRRSESALQQSTDTGNGIAVSLLHDAIEHSLYLILLKEHVSPKSREEFKALLSATSKLYEEKTKAELPFQRHMENLNRHRVEFKHHGNVPSRGTTLEVCEHGEAFIAKLMQEFFGLNIETFHPLSTIRNSEIRTHLEEAQAFSENEDHTQAICAAANANWFLDSAFREVFTGQDQWPPIFLAADRATEKIYGEITNFILAGDRSTLVTSMLIASGLDLFDHIKLGRILPRTTRSHGAKFFHDLRKSSYTADDVQFSVGQITRVTLWIEERFPTLQHDGKNWSV